MKKWTVNENTKDCFASEHINTTIIATIFKLKSGGQDSGCVKEHIALREFRFSTVDSELQSYWERVVDQIEPFCPLDEYDSNLTSWHISESVHPDDFYLSLPADEEVYLKYRYGTSIGCGHYCRGCLVECPDCLRFYGCRMCHDEAEEHKMRPESVNIVKCRHCGKEELFSQDCSGCGLRFGWYCCYKCKLICDLGTDIKPIFHSENQGECAIGIEELMTYCSKCKWNYYSGIFESHKCVEVVGECCCCFEEFGNNTKSRMVMDCNHIIHSYCFEQMLSNGEIACPLCRRTMLDSVEKKQYQVFYRGLAEKYFCLLEFCEYLCNDCGLHFNHFLNSYAVECPRCDFFNTKVVEEIDFSYNDLESWLSGEKLDQATHFNELGFKGKMDVSDFENRTTLDEEGKRRLGHLLQHTQFSVNSVLINNFNEMLEQADEEGVDFVLLVETFVKSFQETRL